MAVIPAIWHHSSVMQVCGELPARFFFNVVLPVIQNMIVSMICIFILMHLDKQYLELQARGVCGMNQNFLYH